MTNLKNNSVVALWWLR